MFEEKKPIYSCQILSYTGTFYLSFQDKMSDFESDSVPSDIEAGAENVVASLIPEKSREAYKQAFFLLLFVLQNK